MTDSPEAGLRLEKRGQHADAATMFERLSYRLGRPDLRNQAAINWRLAGRPTRAHLAFDRAYIMALNARDKALADRIRRDKAMLCFEQGEYDLAHRLLRDTHESQKNRGDALEAAVTLGFLGRIEYSRDGTYRQLRAADQALRGGHEVYELNNLIWLMKAIPWRQRPVSAIRAIRLAVKTGYRRRALEAVVLTVGGNRLYGLLDKR